MRPAGSSVTAPSVARSSIAWRSCVKPPSAGASPSAARSLVLSSASSGRRSAISVAGAPSQLITCAWPSTDRICPSALMIATAPSPPPRRARLRLAVAEHRRERVRRLKFSEIAIAEEIDQRPVGVERMALARDEEAGGQAVQNGAGVALNLVAVGAAGWIGLAFAIPGLIGAGLGSGIPGAVRATGLVRVILARSRRAADQRARDFPESVALASLELDALGGEAERRLAGQRLERARADRDDIGRHGRRRRMAQDIDLGGALGRRAAPEARRGRTARPPPPRPRLPRAAPRGIGLPPPRGDPSAPAWKRGYPPAPIRDWARSAPRRFRAPPPQLRGRSVRADARIRIPRSPPAGRPRLAQPRARRQMRRRPRSPHPARRSRDSPEVRDDGRISVRPKA